MGTAKEMASEAPKKSLPLAEPLLALFWELSELDQSRQIEATARLIAGLREGVDAAGSSGDEETPALKALTYTLNRLIRGLASNRKGVRWGFGTALTVLLQEFTELKTSNVLLELEEHLKITLPSDMKTMAVGQLTVYMALVNSGRMQTTNASHLRTIVTNLLKLEAEKSYLRSGTYEILMQMMEKVPTEVFQRCLLPQLKGHFTSKSLTEMDLDGVLLVLRAFQFHKKAMEPVLLQTFGTADLLDVNNIEEICKLLFKTSTRVLHRAVYDFTEAYQARPDAFPIFWAAMLAAASKETPWKAKIPFEVLPSLIKNVTKPTQLLPIVTPQLLYFLLRNSTDPNGAESESLKAMHGAARHALKLVVSALQTTKDQAVILIVLHLVLTTDAVEQTSRSWSSFVTGLLHRLDTENNAKVAEILLDIASSYNLQRLQIVKVLETILIEKVKTVEDVPRFEKLIAFFGREGIYPINSDTSITSKGIFKFVSSSWQEQHYHRPSTVVSMPEVEKEIALKCAVIKAYVKKLDQSPDLKEKGAVLLKAVGKLPLNPNLKQAFELFALTITGLWIQAKPLLGNEMLTEFALLVSVLTKTGKKLTDNMAAGKLVEFILTLLTVERPIFETVSLIFKALCPFLDEETVALVFELVEPAEEDADQEGQPIEFESSDEEEEEEEEDSDVDDAVAEPQDLASEKAALRQTLTVVQADEDAESEPDLDDAAMFKLDEVLSSIMRSRKADKNGLASSDVDPRFRALRLVHILFCFPGTDPLVILPFLRSVIRIATEKVPVSQRQRQSQIVDLCGKVLQSLKCQKKFDVVKIKAATSKEDVADVLSEVIEETGKVTDMRLHSQCCEAALFIQRVLASVFISGLERNVAIKTVKKLYLPGLEKLASKRSWMFGHLLWSVLLDNLVEYSGGLVPDLFDIIFSEATIPVEGAKSPNKIADEVAGGPQRYLPIRQVQLCNTVTRIIRAQTSEVEAAELEGFITKFGQSFAQLLERTSKSEGELKGKKLFETVTELARAIVVWHRKKQKDGAKLASLMELWSVDKMLSLLDKLVNEKLTAKEVKALKKTMQNFRTWLEINAKPTDATAAIVVQSAAVDSDAESMEE